MPNHSPTHLAKMAQRSAAQRRTDKLARLVADAPALNPAQVCRLKALLDERCAAAPGGQQ